MALKTLTKQPRESRLYDFDFSKLVRTGDAIVDIYAAEVAPDDQNISIDSQVTDNQTLVQIRVSGGVTDTKYKLTILVDTVLGDRVELDGYLKVVES